MKRFPHNMYCKYLEECEGGSDLFDIETTARLASVLGFFFHEWWKVDLKGLEFLPKKGPALIVGNHGSFLPWPGLMLMYGLMSHKSHPRRLNILADMDWINDERLHRTLLKIGFVPWSSDNCKRLFAQEQLVAIFPEGTAGMYKPFSQRYRLHPFNWTKFLPATCEHIPIYPLATLGSDESVPIFTNLSDLAQLLNLPAYPLTPFFPWFPFPTNLLSFPGNWKIRILKSTHYQVKGNREDLENTAKQNATFVEGEIQAELNRLLRARIKAPF
ncbi:MAG: 1-acyl-sn-glycerol-3-phosphate acyltransferase [Candidatus Melainabacteria bacterium]|nr:1-acyl-sn-glycerol-3-phosphate acyltransferase [Candidatus Melainabacteria bacterium]